MSQVSQTWTQGCRTQLYSNAANKTDDVSLFASTIRVTQDVFKTSNERPSRKWYLDSGCLTYLCREEEKFDMTNGKLNLANDSSTEAKTKR